jgi:hypothetical protein
MSAAHLYASWASENLNDVAIVFLSCEYHRYLINPMIFIKQVVMGANLGAKITKIGFKRRAGKGCQLNRA